MSLSAGVRSVFGFLYKAVKQGLDLAKTGASLVKAGFTVALDEIVKAGPKLIEVITRKPQVTLINLPARPTISDMSESPLTLRDNYLVRYSVTLKNPGTGTVTIRPLNLGFTELPNFEGIMESPYSIFWQSEILLDVQLENIWVETGVWSSWGEYGTYWG